MEPSEPGPHGLVGSQPSTRKRGRLLQTEHHLRGGLLAPIRRNRDDQIVGEPPDVRTFNGASRPSRHTIWGGWKLAVHPPARSPGAASRRFLAHVISGLGLAASWPMGSGA